MHLCVCAWIGAKNVLLYLCVHAYLWPLICAKARVNLLTVQKYLGALAISRMGDGWWMPRYMPGWWMPRTSDRRKVCFACVYVTTNLHFRWSRLGPEWKSPYSVFIRQLALVYCWCCFCPCWVYSLLCCSSSDSHWSSRDRIKIIRAITCYSCVRLYKHIKRCHSLHSKIK